MSVRAGCSRNAVFGWRSDLKTSHLARESKDSSPEMQFLLGMSAASLEPCGIGAVIVAALPIRIKVRYDLTAPCSALTVSICARQ